MATKEVDVKSMSFAELQALVQKASAALDKKRVEEIKILADAYSKKAEAAGFSIQEAIDALKPMLPAKAEKKKRAARGTATKKEQPFERGVTYSDPAKEGKDWTAGSTGAKPQWLRAIVEGLSFEEAKAKYASLAKK